MQQSLRTLLAGIVDYAGVFPPTRLPFGEAVRNYARYRAEPEAWMLSRFVCPVAGLSELAPLCEELFTPESPCRLSVIGEQHPLSPEFLMDVRAIDQFVKAHGESAPIEALEVRIPRETIEDWDPDTVAEGLNVLATKLVEHHFSRIEVFLEPLFGPDWSETVRQVVAALQRHDQERGDPAPARIAFKLRTGGPDPAAVCTVEQLALAIANCRDADVPLKFTGGLQRPLRHSDDVLNTDLHGFLNIFAAGALLLARDIDQPTLQGILDERDAQAFAFADDELRWRDLEVTIDEIESARRGLTLSFGSCSFDEPREHLGELGLL